MKIKRGASLNGLKIEMRKPLAAAGQIWEDAGHELVVTSGTDGTHSAGSLHYYGYALDFRTRYFDEPHIVKIAHSLRKALSDEYDVIIHKSHIHVEFDYSSQ
jgi:hypothetical protein